MSASHIHAAVNQFKNFCRDSKPQKPKSCDSRRQREADGRVEVSQSRRRSTVRKRSECEKSTESSPELQVAINCRSSDGFFLSLLTSPTNTITRHAALIALLPRLLTLECKRAARHNKVIVESPLLKQKPHTELHRIHLQMFVFHMHVLRSRPEALGSLQFAHFLRSQASRGLFFLCYLVFPSHKVNDDDDACDPMTNSAVRFYFSSSQ
jgi:hypothetical protein